MGGQIPEDSIAPLITINYIDPGEDTQPGYDVIQNLRIKWGTTNHWEDIEPATLSVTVLDLTQNLDTLRGWLGKPIRVLLPVPAQGQRTIFPENPPLFRGEIISIEVEAIKIFNTKAGLNQTGYLVHIEAEDITGRLGRDRRLGSNNMYGGTTDKVHWRHQDGAKRKAALAARGAQINGNLAFQTVPQAMSYDAYEGYTRNQIVSVLTVLRETIRAVSFDARPVYNHGTGRFDIWKIPVNTAYGRRDYTSFYKGENLKLATISGKQNPKIIDGSHCEIVGSRGIHLEQVESVTTAEIKHIYMSIESGQDAQVIEKLTQVGIDTSNREQSTVQITSGLSWTATGSNAYTGNHVETQYTALRELIRGLDGITAPPPFKTSINAEIYHSPEAWNDWRVHLLKCYPSQPLYMKNSIYNSIEASNSFVVSGGAISYHKNKYEIECDLIPVQTSKPAATATLGSLASTQVLANLPTDQLINDLERNN